MKLEKKMMNKQNRWLDLAQELQFLAQGGLAYTKDKFDQERFERIRQISAEMVALQSDLPIATVTSLFCNETGFQTPKLDSRGAVFKGDKILLVQESDGRWSIPGGGVDALASVKENTIRELQEEAGIEAQIVKVIAILDRNIHNTPRYAYGITKIFIECSYLGGAFKPNIETLDSGYFSLDELPELAEEKVTLEQIKMCFKAHFDDNWQCLCD